MFFVHASLGWLDIYMLTFMLAGFLLYLHKAYVPMGIAFALSVLCKFSGGLGILAVGLHWLLTTRDNKKQMIISLIVMVLSFLLLMTIFQYFITGILVNPVRWTMVILRLTASKKFFVNLPVNPDDYPYSQVYYTMQPVDSAATRPWAWLLPHKIFSYAATGIQYLSFISWTIQILIVPALIYMVYKAVCCRFWHQLVCVYVFDLDTPGLDHRPRHLRFLLFTGDRRDLYRYRHGVIADYR
jgi:predicted membrane-bound dolichyl-phosphate-mannose-protein mannosyltransferase